MMDNLSWRNGLEIGSSRASRFLFSFSPEFFQYEMHTFRVILEILDDSLVIDWSGESLERISNGIDGDFG